jgi:branched-chain amino acid transport system substrate-binding protein
VTVSDVGAQIARLKSSGADTLVIFAGPPFAAQAYEYAEKFGWKPKRVVNSSLASVSTSTQKTAAQGQPKLANGTISMTFFKEPADPRWKSDSGLRLYRKILGAYAASADVDDPLHVYGMAVAWSAVDALRKAGKNLSRESLREVVDGLTVAGNPFLLPGIIVRTSADDHFPLEQMMLKRWQNGGWRSFGGLWTSRAP